MKKKYVEAIIKIKIPVTIKKSEQNCDAYLKASAIVQNMLWKKDIVLVSWESGAIQTMEEKKE